VAKVPRFFNRVGAVAKPGSKIGSTVGITDRTVARGEAVTTTPGLGDNRTQADTYFTSGPIVGEPPQLIYTGDRFWAKVTLTLETAGPVAVGTTTKVQPVLGGGGRLLVTNEQISFTIAKGTRLYVAATGVNRIGRVIEPLPWLEQITGLLGAVAGGIARLATGKSGR
jgi:hypothetical protein